MLSHKILEPAGILVLQPDAAITVQDVTALVADVNTYLQSHKTLNGVLIDTKKFPGYASLSAFTAHLRFVEDFHQRVKKVALVTDSALAEDAAFMGKHFAGADIRTFPYAQEPEALAWLEAA